MISTTQGLPANCPDLPDHARHWVILGMGGQFDRLPGRDFEAYAIRPGNGRPEWDRGMFAGNSSRMLYAAPGDSPIVRANLPPLPSDAQIYGRGPLPAAIRGQNGALTPQGFAGWRIDPVEASPQWVYDTNWRGDNRRTIYAAGPPPLNDNSVQPHLLDPSHLMNRPDLLATPANLPAGAIYLGQGGSFTRVGAEFDGWVHSGESNYTWRHGNWIGNSPNDHYAARADSAIVRGTYPELPEGYHIVGYCNTPETNSAQDGDLIIGRNDSSWFDYCTPRHLGGLGNTAGARLSPSWVVARKLLPAALPEPVARARRQWALALGSDPVDPEQLRDTILPFLDNPGHLERLANDLDEALRRSDPEVSIEHWIELEPTLLSVIEFTPIASGQGVDIAAIAESTAAISDVIIKASAGVLLRGGFSDHFRYLEDGTLAIDPSSPPTVEQAYELLKRTLEMKETASKLENHSAWMLGMIADQFESYFQDRFDPSIVMAQTSRAYNTYICSLKTFRTWWAEKRQLSFTHHREVEYSKHLDHESGGKVLDLSEQFGLTVLQQRKLISYAKRFDVAALQEEMASGTESVEDLMERIDIRAVNKRYLFFLRTANRWYEYKGPFENIPNGASPIINLDSRETMGQDGRATKPDEWVPVGTIASPAVLATAGVDEPDEEDEEDEDDET